MAPGLPRRSYAVAVAVPLLLVALLGIARPPFLADAANFIFDEFQRLRPRAWDPQAPVVRPDWLPGAELLLSLALSLIVGVALPLLRPAVGAFGVLVAIAAVGAASWQVFAAQNVLAAPVLPGIALAASYLSCLAWVHWDERQQRRSVREAFSRHVSPAVAARLAVDRALLALGGETRELTILFCDVRGFTAIAERLDAQALTQFMNAYHTDIMAAVLAQDGTVDKYIGAAVMAFWNAPIEDPQHATRAARAALGMLAALERFAPVRCGIGLATGACCVGNFGSAQRFDYSVLGDSANIAARLEAATEFYHVDILASEATVQAAPDLAWLELDEVRLRGRSDVLRVFALIGDEAVRASEAFRALADRHARILEAYRAGNFTTAVLLARVAQGSAAPRQAVMYAEFERRCDALARSKPESWTPVTVLEQP